MINFEQQGYRPLKGEGVAPRDYFDPNIMLADKAFKLEPNEEILVVINGHGYRYNDDTIYALDVKAAAVADDNVEIDGSGSGIETLMHTPSHLCYVIKNCSSNFKILVGYRTPLQWLLDMPKLFSRFCYCSIADINKCRFALAKDVDVCGHYEETLDFIPPQDETIVIRY